MRSLVLIILMVVYVSSLTSAQELNNLRSKTLHVDNDSLKIDSLSIIPGSLNISDPHGKPIDSTAYLFDPANALLIFNEDSFKILSGNDLRIRYRVFPIDFSKTYQNKDIEWILPVTEEPYSPFVYQQEETQKDLFASFSDLSKSGSISRGVSFGNNQDVVVNSNFNLQLAGKLGRDVDVIAAITDNNIPIQPEGNTQQIQEFDKVYIKLMIKNTSLIAGDFDLTRPKSHFMNFFKKAQGGDLTTNFMVSNQKKGKTYGNMQVRAAAALSKGKFARNRIQGVEGNQGPYKLQGNEGETYIIVLSGSEKVYIDGRLLTRGETNDYVINYNTGEITFTPNILITKDKRITVEFEYSDKKYARALFFAGSSFENEKLQTRVHFFSEQDLKNQSLDQDLTDDQKRLMSNIGDSIQDALILNADSVGFSNEQVRYKVVDTLVNGIYYDSVFIYSTNPDSAFYRVGFSFVGDENGNYKLIRSDANGKVYQWVAPVNGIPQGNYEPVRLLTTPKKRHMLVWSTDYNFSRETRMSAEVALSNLDINTFSGLDNKNNVGYAGKISLSDKRKIGSKNENPWLMGSGLYYEWVHQHFNELEPYRPVEFDRDWNISEEENQQQHLAGVDLSFEKDQTGFINYELRSLINGDFYRGLRNKLNFDVNFKNFRAIFDGSLLNTRDQTFNTMFVRSRADVSKKFKWFKIGVNHDQEYNSFKDQKSDSLLLNSFSYFEWGAYAMNVDTVNTSIRLFYKERKDRAPLENTLRPSTLARETGLTVALQKNRNNRLTLTTTYRDLQIIDSTLSIDDPEQNLVGRIEHFLRLKKGLLSANTFYEVGSGTEEKQEFSYLKVPDGEGVYIWNDYNEDGIQQLNEFEVAAFKDQANYIRIFSPSNDFIRSYFNKFSITFQLIPATVWSKEEGFKKFASRFSDQLAFRIEHKTSDNNPNIAYNPFISEKTINDSVLLSLGSSFRNTLYFDRNNPRFGFDINYQNNRNKALLINGFETRIFRLSSLNVRWNFYEAFSAKLNYEFNNKLNTSEYFTERDYKITANKVKPVVSYEPGSSVRLDLKYNFTRKENSPELGNASAIIHDFGLEFNYKVINKGSLLIQVNYLDVFYNDIVNTPLAFEMLEGFLPGNNGTWSISYQQNIAKHLQMDLLYNGRKSPGVKTVHVGSVQLRAYF